MQEQTGAAKMTFPPSNSGLMDFDFNDLSLDLDVPEQAIGSAAGGISSASSKDIKNDDSLTTKLALAHEFHAIGDSEGARTLVEEVIDESSGTLKARARQLLAEMD